MNKRVGETITFIYESFILRDLAYIFGGSLILGFVYYATERNIIPAIDYVTQNILKFMFFVFISYCCGIIAHTVISLIEEKLIDLFKKERINQEKEKKKTILSLPYLLDNVKKQCGDYSARAIERIFFIRLLNRVIYSSSIICTLIISILIITDLSCINLILLGLTIAMIFTGFFEQKKRLQH